VTLPTPALVTASAAERLPRLALLLLCAAYVLPGQFFRDPWKNADIAAFGTMRALAQGRTDWGAPELAGLDAAGSLLPHWLGAGAIMLLGPLLGDAQAARLPFALLLALTLALVWYSTFHLARTEAAQPVPFAFGGEASSTDYARALADGALLALIASLGLLQLGHETTPELMQLAAVAGLLWALAVAPVRVRAARVGAMAALGVLALSGAPAIAVGLGAAAAVVCARSTYPLARALMPWVLAGTALAAGAGALAGGWALRLAPGFGPEVWLRTGRLLLWFPWPAWPLALWTLWRWRRHLTHRHIAVPLASVAVAGAAAIAMGGSDRALLLALPGLAVLAAFALPTFRRSTGAAIDWFSVFFFSAVALTIWVIFVAMHTGVPAKPAANVMRLAPGFEPRFHLGAALLAIAGTLAWAGLVRWRTARNRHPLWKTLVLPATGVALCWLLLMTLWLPLLDYDRSYRPLVARVERHVPPGSCIAALGLSRSQVAALEVFGRFNVVAAGEAPPTCRHLVRPLAGADPVPAGWQPLARVSRPTDRREVLSIHVR
jgi:hypothetical protein